MMRLRDLEQALQIVQPFDTKVQKIELEQFPTSYHIASRVVHAATTSDDIEGKVVVDLGTGTGMLGIGCALMGAAHVVGVDADPDALVVAASNIEAVDVEETMDLVLSDVSSLPMRTRMGVLACDTVIMNPPFGTRNAGIDVIFLKTAIQLKPCVIYSMHKSSTRNFLVKKASIEWGLKVEVLAELAFDIPKMYKMHKDKSRDVAVDLIRFELPAEMREGGAAFPPNIPPPPPPLLSGGDMGGAAAARTRDHHSRGSKKNNGAKTSPKSSASRQERKRR